MAIKLNFIKMWLPIQNYLKNKWRAFTFTFLTGTLIITLLGCTQPKKTETTFSLLIIVTWPTLVHRELHQHVKLAKNEVYQPSQVATMKNLPVPQAERKARVKKTKEMKAGGPAKQLSESILGI